MSDADYLRAIDALSNALTAGRSYPFKLRLTKVVSYNAATKTAVVDSTGHSDNVTVDVVTARAPVANEGLWVAEMGSGRWLGVFIAGSVGSSVIPICEWNKPGPITAVVTSDNDMVDYDETTPLNGHRLLHWDIALTTAPTTGSISVAIRRNGTAVQSTTVNALNTRITPGSNFDAYSWGAPSIAAGSWGRWSVAITNVGDGTAAGLTIRATFQGVVI